MSRIMLSFIFTKRIIFRLSQTIYATLINNMLPTWYYDNIYLHGGFVYLLSTTIISFPYFYSIVTTIYRTYLPTYLLQPHVQQRCYIPTNSHNPSLSLSFLIPVHISIFFLLFNFLSLHINQSVTLSRAAISSVGVLGVEVL